MDILLLESDFDSGDSMARALASQGHKVDWAHDSKTAAAMLQEHRYEFVLGHHSLLDEEGTRILSSNAIPRFTRIIYTTEIINKETMTRMFRLGVSGYLLKPVSANELTRHVRFHSRCPRSSSVTAMAV